MTRPTYGYVPAAGTDLATLDARYPKKTDQVVRVEDYGAVGDDTADDSTALGNALAAGMSLGRPVAFRVGATYKITAALPAITGALAIQGNGATIRNATASAGVLTITGSDVSVERLRLVGPGGGSGDAAQPKAIDVHGATWAGRVKNIRIVSCRIEGFRMYAIFAKFVEQMRVQSCHIENIWHAGVMLQSVANSTVDDCDITTINNTPNAYGVAATRVELGTTLASDPQCSDIDITNNRVSNVPAWEGLDTHAGIRIKFDGNTVTGCKYGIAVVPCQDTNNALSVYAPVDCTVTSNIVDSGVTDGSALVGINFVGASDSGLRATGTITGNIVRGYGAENSNISGGILLHDTDGVTVDSNTIINSSPNGINLYFANRGVSVVGNTIIDPWSNSGTESLAIKVASSNNSGVISGNSFIRGSLTGKTYMLPTGMRFPNQSGISIALGTNFSQATTYMVDQSPAGSVYGMVFGTASGTVAQGNDNRFASQFEIPADRGFLGWSMPVVNAVAGGVLSAAGTLNLVRVRRVPAGNITSISAFVTVAGVTLTSGQCFAAAFTAGGTLIGVSADQSTAWTSVGFKTMALAGGPFAFAGGDVYVGLWYNGTTSPQFSRSTAASVLVTNLALSAPNLQAASADTGLTTAAPSSFGTQTATNGYFWTGVS